MNRISLRGRLVRLTALSIVTVLLVSCSSSSGDSEKSLPPAVTSASATTTTTPQTTVAPATTTTTTTAAAATTPSTQVAVPTTVAPTTPATAATVLVLSGNGIGLSNFEADPDQSVQYVTTILGPPTSDSGWVDANTSPFGDCVGTSVRGVRWGDLLLLYGDLAAADGIRAFFGYNLGSLSRPTTGKPGGIRTAKGITLGSTVADVRAAYPEVAIVDGTPPTFDVADPSFGGTLSDVAQNGIVTTIYGGTGCTA